jgi:inositol-phosphate phosphatase/L-galactose 1-phosphate phosphatase/histidinol-phosphatase
MSQAPVPQMPAPTASPAAIGNTFMLLASRMADASGAVIRRYFRANFGLETKGDKSPVTAADREAEQAIRQILQKERPKDGIWGEEFGSSDMTADFLWIIDPIDGTGSFMTGRPIFGTLIGMYRNGNPVLGVIDQPVTRERWIGALGHPTTLNGRPVKCRSCPDLASAHIGTWGPASFASEKTLAKFNRISSEANFTIYGGDCYLYAQLATGCLDAVIDERMNLHDFAALIPVVEGAGGKITDWNGEPLRLQEKSPVLACGDARLHAQLLEMLSK